MKEITGIFKTKQDLDNAFEELEKIGITQEDIDLLAREKDVRTKLGQDYSSVYDLDNESGLPRIKYISDKLFFKREDKAFTTLFYLGMSGALITTIILHKSIGTDIAIAFFVGTFLQVMGMSISGILRKRRGDYIERKLNKGGLIFWIRVDNLKLKQHAVIEILKKHSAKNIH